MCGRIARTSSREVLAAEFGIAQFVNVDLGPRYNIPPSETVATTSLFRDAFRSHRCLIVADGFYEWRRDGRRKTPYFIRLRSHRPFGFAAVWTWQPAAVGTRTPTCAIVTCPPNALMAEIHDRMPVILPADSRDEWLDPRADTVELQKLLVPLVPEELEAYEVSPVVNSPRNDSPECVQPVG